MLVVQLAAFRTAARVVHEPRLEEVRGGRERRGHESGAEARGRLTHSFIHKAK